MDDVAEVRGQWTPNPEGGWAGRPFRRARRLYVRRCAQCRQECLAERHALCEECAMEEKPSFAERIHTGFALLGRF